MLAAGRQGAITTLPLALPVVPVGLVFGLLVDETTAVSRAAGIASSPIVLGGASQIAAVSVLGAGGGAIVAALTIAVVNARHMMYSARLRLRWRHLPLWFRIVAPYVLLDQAFAVAELRHAERRRAEQRRCGEQCGERPAVEGSGDGREPGDVGPASIDGPTEADLASMGHFLGSGAVLAVLWWVAAAVGVLGGDVVPASLELGFSVPLLFGGLLVLSVTDRAGVGAAVVGGLLAVAAADMPAGSGVLVGAFGGVAAGGLVDAWWGRRR